MWPFKSKQHPAHTFSVTVRNLNGRVVTYFDGQSITYLSLDADNAKTLAQSLIQNANALTKQPPQVKAPIKPRKHSK